MNCGCDKDCTEEDRRLFTDNLTAVYDPNHRSQDNACIKSYLMYRENANRYRINRKNDSLFCVVTENLVDKRDFNVEDMKRIRRKISHGKIDSKPKYGWDTLHSLKPFEMKRTPYKYDSPIWIVRMPENDTDGYEDNSVMLRLPAPYHTDLCSLNEPVKFLKRAYSTCRLPIFPVDLKCESLPALNVNHFIANYVIILNPANVGDNFTDNTGAVIRAVACRNNDWNNCETIKKRGVYQNLSNFLEDIAVEDEVSFPSPVLNISTHSCLNVLSHLNFTFIHNGTEGITQAIATAMFVDIPLDKKELEQHFSVDFIWGRKEKVPIFQNDSTEAEQETSIEDVFVPPKKWESRVSHWKANYSRNKGNWKASQSD